MDIPGRPETSPRPPAEKRTGCAFPAHADLPAPHKGKERLPLRAFRGGHALPGLAHSFPAFPAGSNPSSASGFFRGHTHRSLRREGQHRESPPFMIRHIAAFRRNGPPAPLSPCFCNTAPRHDNPKSPAAKGPEGSFPPQSLPCFGGEAEQPRFAPSGSPCRIPNASLQSTHRAGASPAPQSPQPVPAFSGRRDSPCQSPTACPRPAQGHPFRRKAHALPPSARNRLRPSARRIMKRAFFSRPYWTAGEKRI